MSKLSAEQVGALAKEAGVPDGMLATAIAVAGGESDFDTEARGGGATGLWQIQLDAHTEFSDAQMTDPKQNAAAMMKISGGGTNWQPWVAYTNGSYMRHMAEATAAAAKLTGKSPSELSELLKLIPGAGAVAGAIGGVADGVSAVNAFMKKLIDPNTWKFGGLFVVGSMMILWALFKLTGDNHLSGLSKTVVSGAMLAIPGIGEAKAVAMGAKAASKVSKLGKVAKGVSTAANVKTLTAPRVGPTSGPGGFSGSGQPIATGVRVASSGRL